MLKKLICLASLVLLAGCGAQYESVPVTYYNANHDTIADSVLGDRLSDEEIENQFNNNVIELYYNELSEGAYDIQVWNESDYYYSGEVALPECEKSIQVKAVPPHSGIVTTLVCPEFDVEADFEYSGDLYERKADKQLSYAYEMYYYEDVADTYDAVLDVTELNEDTIKQFAEYLYEEFVLMNIQNSSTVHLFTSESYMLDTYEEACKGYIWIDQANDFVEIMDIDGNLIERVNYRA